MALIRVTHTDTATINLRVPVPVKQEMLALRKLADKYAVDFTATLAAMFEGSLKTIRSELEALDRKPASHANGAAAVKEG